MLFWIWLISTGYLLIRFWKNKVVKIYGYGLGIFVVLSMIPFMLPFIGIITTGFRLDRVSKKDLSDNIRIQVSIKGPMGRPDVEIIRQYVIHEELLGQMSEFDLNDESYDVKDLTGLKILKVESENMYIEFYFPTGSAKHWLDRR